MPKAPASVSPHGVWTHPISYRADATVCCGKVCFSVFCLLHRRGCWRWSRQVWCCRHTDDCVHFRSWRRRGCWRWSWRTCCSGAPACFGACWRRGWPPSWWDWELHVTSQSLPVLPHQGRHQHMASILTALRGSSVRRQAWFTHLDLAQRQVQTWSFSILLSRLRWPGQPARSPPCFAEITPGAQKPPL